MLANTVGQHRLIKAEALSEVLDDLLGLQWNFNRIAQESAIYVRNEANEVIGALPCLTTVLPIYKTTDITYTAPLKLVATDDIASKATLSKAAAELASVEGFEESVTSEILNLTAELSAIDLSDIDNRISELDNLVAKNYRALSEALAAQALLQAKAKVYLDQIAAILKFPIKEAYSALNLGTLGEYTKLEEDDAQRTIITISQPRWFGMRRQTQRQCCKDWVVLKSDGDNGSRDYYFIGEYYSYLINDLKGNALGGEYKNFVKTDEQTRGSGESKQVVVPYTTVGSRKVMHWTNLSAKLNSILDSLYNNEEMMANKKATEIVRLIVQGMDNLKELRQPIIEQLREYMEKAEKIMMLEHSLKLYYSKYKDGGVISIPSNIKYLEMENEELDAYVGMTAYDKEYANSVLRQITVDDKEYIINTAISLQIDKLSNLIVNSKLEAKKKQAEEEEETSKSQKKNATIEEKESSGSEIKEIELKFDEVTKSFGEQNITHLILAADESEIKKSYNEILVTIRKELDEIQKEDVILRFNNELVEVTWEEEVDGIKNGTFSVLGDDLNPQVIFNVTVDRTVKNTIETTVAWHPAAFGKYKDTDDKVCIGMLVYDLETLLKHYMIFKSLPYSDTILKTIKYKLTGSTNATTSDCIQACRQRYGTEVAYYLGSYLSKQPSKAAIVGQLVFAAVGNQELLRIELAAYAEESVMTSILKAGYDAGFAVAYDYVSSDLSI